MMSRRTYTTYKEMDSTNKWILLFAIVALEVSLVHAGCSRSLPGMEQTRVTKHIQIGLTSRTESEASDLCRQWGGQSKVAVRKRPRGCLVGIFIRDEKAQTNYVDRTVPEQCVQEALKAMHSPKRRRAQTSECKYQGFLFCLIPSSSRASRNRRRILPFHSNPGQPVEAPQVCRNSLQQRILPFGRELQECDKSQQIHNWEVIDWVQDSSSQWEMKNTGGDLEIKIQPIGSLRTKVNIRGDVDYINVHTIKIKWGKHARTGSEHSYGKYRHAGEIQIFHESSEKVGGRHAISFFISERQNPPNPAWAEFIPLARINCRSVGDRYTLSSPPSLRNLIGEDASRRGEVHLKHRLLEYTRYTGVTSAPPCEEYIWTVFKNHLYLSKAQFTQLRSIKQSHTRQAKRHLAKRASRQIVCRTRGSLWER